MGERLTSACFLRKKRRREEGTLSPKSCSVNSRNSIFSNHKEVCYFSAHNNARRDSNYRWRKGFRLPEGRRIQNDDRRAAGCSCAAQRGSETIRGRKQRARSAGRKSSMIKAAGTLLPEDVDDLAGDGEHDTASVIEILGANGIIVHRTIPIPKGGGITVLKGRCGSGKTTALDGISTLLGNRSPALSANDTLGKGYV